MSHRLSKQEKGKWTAGGESHGKKSPVQIPKADNSALIQKTALTLIGRVSNPAVQKPKAVVDFFLQYWSFDKKVTGRELGLEVFQFKFETETDLQSVLNKAYHYKKWMLILQ